MKSFKITNLGDAKFYLGIKLIQRHDGIYFHQQGYIQRLLDKFGMSDCIPFSTPLNPKTKLAKDSGTNFVDPTTYQSLVEGLLHATISWWDIQFSVGCVSRYMTNPQLEHMVAAKNILKYLKGSLDYGIFYPKYNSNILIAFSYAHWEI